MTDRIFTAIPGRPSDFEVAETYLRKRLCDGAEDLSDDVLGQRRRLAGLFEGDSERAFDGRTTALVTTTDHFARATDASATQVQALGATLKNTQDTMLILRTEAIVSGLECTDTHILRPPSGAPPSQVEKWDDLLRRHEEAIRSWWDVLEESGTFLEGVTANLLAIGSGLLVAAYTGRLLGRMQSDLLASAAEKSARAQRFQQYADELAELLESGQVPGTPDNRSRFYGLIDYSSEVARAAGEDAAAAASPALPRGVGPGLDVLGNLAVGYSIYDDIRGGEPVDQALVSQGSGVLTGLLAGGRAGALLGSRVHPLFGTLGGGLVGGIVGALTDWGVDEAYESDDAPRVVPLEGGERAEREGDILDALEAQTDTSALELVMDHDQMKQTQGHLFLAADELEAAGRHSPTGDYGDAQALVELIIGAHEEVGGALGAECTMIGVALGLCSADGQQVDAQRAFELLRMTRIE